MNQQDKAEYGTKNKKEIRKLKTQERLAEQQSLSDEEKQKRIEENKVNYDNKKEGEKCPQS